MNTVGIHELLQASWPFLTILDLNDNVINT